MGLGKLLDAAGIGHALLTGKVQGEQAEILQAEEEIGVLFRTHALFQAGVQFAASTSRSSTSSTASASGSGRPCSRRAGRAAAAATPIPGRL